MNSAGCFTPRLDPGQQGRIVNNEVQLLGYPILAARMAEVVDFCESIITSGRRVQLGVLNAAKIVNASKNEQLAAAIRSCDVLLADGQSVVWAGRLLGKPLPERVAGIDLFLRLLELADRQRMSVYLVGANRDVIERVADMVGARHPNLVLAGYRDGYFDDVEAEDVALHIRRTRPDMLFLGMTSPKKEVFLSRFGSMMGVPICHGVGGSFDVVAGVTKRAPVLWQRAGLEWAYRLLQEPGRMWRRYLVTNSAFIALVIKELVRSKRPNRPGRRRLAVGVS